MLGKAETKSIINVFLKCLGYLSFLSCAYIHSPVCESQEFREWQNQVSFTHLSIRSSFIY